jgi:hypothetical protein
MPFRSNFFGEQIAQPGTSFEDIAEILINRLGVDTIEIASADLFMSGDDEYKFGGTLHFSTSIEDMEGGEPDYNDASIEFDGFESLSAAKEWLQSLDPSISIYEVN